MGVVEETADIAQERESTDCVVSETDGVLLERTGTNGRVIVGDAVAAERIGTNGRVKTAGGVAQERSSANSGEVPAGGVHEPNSKTNGQVEVGGAVSERLRSNGHVKVAAHVSPKCATTNRDVIIADSITRKRIFTHGGVVDSGCDGVQRAVSHSRVSTCATRAWTLCFEWRRKRKVDEREQREQQINNICDRFHAFISFHYSSPETRGAKFTKMLPV